MRSVGLWVGLVYVQLITEKAERGGGGGGGGFSIGRVLGKEQPVPSVRSLISTSQCTRANGGQ